jgi:hypothetical protein
MTSVTYGRNEEYMRILKQYYQITWSLPCPIFYKLENTAFRRLDLFSASVKRERHYYVGSLERANLNRPVIGVSSL